MKLGFSANVYSRYFNATKMKPNALIAKEVELPVLLKWQTYCSVLHLIELFSKLPYVRSNNYYCTESVAKTIIFYCVGLPEPNCASKFLSLVQLKKL